jgi:hypothetical protein
MILRLSFAFTALSLFLASCSSDSSDVAPSTDAGNDAPIATDAAPQDASTDVATDVAARDASADVSDAAQTCASLVKQQAVANAMHLPMSRADFALDLDGDSRVDNQLGNLVGAFSAQGLGPQMATDAAFVAGREIVLFEESSADAMFASASCASARQLRGAPQSMPDFSNNGAFTIDTSVPPAAFVGTMASSIFDSPAPTTLRSPTTTKLPIWGVEMPVVVTHLSVKNIAGKAKSAQLNGAMKKTDVDTILVPAIAASLTQILQADPSSQQAMQVKQTFDVGDGHGGQCTNADSTKGTANDGVVSPCELSGNAAFGMILAPDVQLFDMQGNYAPTSPPTKRDSVSLGVTFALVGASF